MVLSICGLICTECPAYGAEGEDNLELRIETAKRWSELFEIELDPEDIRCDGCTSRGGRLFRYCKVCEVRTCGLERGVLNCFVCSEYPCPKIARLHKSIPEAMKPLGDPGNERGRD